MMNNLTHTIDGAGQGSEGSFEVCDPSTSLPFALCPDGSGEQLDLAVLAARRAQRQWEASGWEARGEAVLAFSNAVRQELDSVARLLTHEQGKPLEEARAELMRACESMDSFSRQQLKSVVLRDDDMELVVEHFYAAGVAAVISPWNSPLGLFTLRVIPLLMSGSTVVQKPSPYTPLSSLRLGEIGRRVFPPGVLNVIAGRDPLGQWMTDHPGIDRVSFTGSVRTGKRVMASAAESLKRVGLELGGNDPAIVLADADVKKVAPKLLWAALRNCGQICMAVKRIYAHESVHDELVRELEALVSGIKVGSGLAQGTQLGPLQNRMQYDFVQELIADTRQLPGVRIHVGTETPSGEGYFVSPYVVSNVDDAARIVCEEQFGPVIPVLKFTELEDVLQRANSTCYGLSASVWSSDPKKAAEVGARIQAGTVWVNNHMMLDADIPFGGWKTSGIGRGNGLLGLQNCMESQVVRVLKTPA